VPGTREQPPRRTIPIKKTQLKVLLITPEEFSIVVYSFLFFTQL
jgi:hypothetical protein